MLWIIFWLQSVCLTNIENNWYNRLTDAVDEVGAYNNVVINGFDCILKPLRRLLVLKLKDYGLREFAE